MITARGWWVTRPSCVRETLRSRRGGRIETATPDSRAKLVRFGGGRGAVVAAGAAMATGGAVGRGAAADRATGDGRADVERLLEEKRPWIAESSGQVPRLGLDPSAVSESEARTAARELVSALARGGRAHRRRVPANPHRRATHALGLVLSTRHALLQLAARARAARYSTTWSCMSSATCASRTIRGGSGRSSRTSPALAPAARLAARPRTRAPGFPPAGLIPQIVIATRQKARNQGPERLARLIKGSFDQPTGTPSLLSGGSHERSRTGSGCGGCDVHRRACWCGDRRRDGGSCCAAAIQELHQPE